jgi:hypothetical protein
MPNISIANVDLGSVLLESDEVGFQPDVLDVPANTTYQEGLILARTTATGRLVAFNAGGSGGAETPKTVLTYDVENDTAGLVQTPVRIPVVAKVRKQRLRIGAAATSDTGVTKAVQDQLRDYGISPVDVTDLSVLDNQ